MFRLYILLISICGTLFTNINNQQEVSGEYIGLWGETIWTYQLNANGSYVYTTSGHFGDIQTFGTYKLSNNTLFLTAKPANKQPDPKRYFMYDTLFRLSDSCIVDLSLGYEYCRMKGKTIRASHKRNIHLKGMPVTE
jgi:hypothetical protein